MNSNNFIGPFKNVAPLYIEYKKSLGFEAKSEYNELKKLDRYFYNKGINEVKLTKDMAEESQKRRTTCQCKIAHCSSQIRRK